MNNIFSNFTNSDFYGYINIGILVIVLASCVLLGISMALKSRYDKSRHKAEKMFSSLLNGTDDKEQN